MEQEHISLVRVDLRESAGEARTIGSDIGGVKFAKGRSRPVTEPNDRLEMSLLGSAVVPDQIRGYPVEPGAGITGLWTKPRSFFKGDTEDLCRQVVGEPRPDATSEVAM